jgi:hypothetical protein
MNDPIWDPRSNALVFQQIPHKALQKPEITLCWPGMKAPRVLAEGF